MTRLAEALDVDLRSITGYEKGEFEPVSANLKKIAEFLRFPIAFFELEDELQLIDKDAASFRSLSKMSASQRDVALYSGALTVTLNRALELRFELPSANLPDLRDADPEVAAAELRRYWDMGEQPIKNAIHLLEAQGVRVYSLAIDAAEVDAFSMWREQIPYVFLNTLKSAERARFDAMHELGHLVLHRHGSPDGGQEIERAANDFASAFLMPRSSVLAYVPKFISLDALVKLKKIWGVSVAALAFRLQRLGVLTEWQYRDLAIQINKRGYRKHEPESMPRETSQILAKAFASLRSEGVSKSNIATELRVDEKDIDEMVFGLILNSVGGNNQHVTDTATTQKPHLTLVKG